MTKPEFIEKMISNVDHIVDQNMDTMLMLATDNLLPGLSKEQIQMCSRVIRLSVQLSCQILLDELCELEIIEPERIAVRRERPVLRLIKGGLDDSTDQ